ncbi:hypothetical protein BGW36DRAFT_302606 [Talaromyces proteolyticus]|uniref:Pre-mRNA splicing factor CLF1 n=1 Tax=Talaromyces proteolyticus TaxID=1131652 RepID=A0AAD4PVD4_9EURO|nr:uncharacterized protein BGW36DRAFT_302606 [Talaromyces proteolyticus]KAH8693194.1 hypothetical protein BGW36DRAFT_302606 [Talaromyces proteolyticus]
MSSPQPPSPLSGHCSVVYDNSLYVYTPSALMMLPLEQNANWTKLDMGQSVTGAACVKGSVDGNPDHQGLFVVGGSSDNSTYNGLQRYSFVDKKWETITLPTTQIQNRVNHSASYLSGSISILVYAGSQDSNYDASTSTFEITMAGGAIGIESRSADGTPPAIRPSLFTWDNETTLYVGGMDTNTDVFVYHAGSGWATSGISLAAGISSHDGVALQSNSDGSKFLEIFNMSASPNSVSYVALTSSGGAAASPGEPVVFTGSSSSKNNKRAWGNLPAYNSTFAPSTSRTGFSIAQSDNGLVVISGGSDSDPVTVFNQTENSWVDNKVLFGSRMNAGLQQPLGTSSTTTSTAPTATSTTTSSSTTTTATASASTTAAASSGSHSNIGLIVGVTLGALAGLVIILIILLMILRRLHRKKQPTNKGRYGSDDKDRLSFQDQGIEPLTQSAVPMARSNAPSAVDSIYMVSGKFASDYPSATPMVTNNEKKVYSRPLVPQNQNDNFSSQSDGTQDPTRRFLDPEKARGDRSTNEGWSKYFQDTTTTDIGMGSPRNTMDSELSQESRSDYGGGMWPHVPEKAAVTLGGLEEHRPLGKVSSASPISERLPVIGRGQVHYGQSAKISSADSASSVSDDDEHEHRDAFSSGIPASVNDTLYWSHPTARPTSSNYTESLYQTSTRNGLAAHDEPLPTDAQSQARGSSAIFHQDYFNGPNRNNINSDMSWLNIHADR